MLFKKYLNKILPVLLLLSTGIAAPLVSLAETAVSKADSASVVDSYDMTRYILVGMMVLLLCVIAILGSAVRSAGKMYWEQQAESKKASFIHKTTGLFLLILLATLNQAMAEEVKEAVVSPSKSIPAAIYILFIMVMLEFVVVLVLAKMLLQFLNTKTKEAKPAKKVQMKVLFQKLNQTVAVEEEHLIDLHHDYDGIRELDNKVPAWWRYSFYASILFGVVYLYRMFISETLPDQFQELETANRIAVLQKAEYLKDAANNIDENNVVMLDASGIMEGGALYVKNCQACHGDKGQGGVGPNLTDDYWLHKGGIKNIFYSIKYGWQEKGMKSWKDDFSPAQMAQLASFVQSLHGSQPPGGKEAQGTLYTDEPVTKGVVDTSIVKNN